ncbi:MAG TPA: DUF6101 family protein [Xanthobacteraceae bacterium]|jgi:hypothetical protein|nr:DUF6101 family protein [Xanthobacteraceae bacterium]
MSGGGTTPAGSSREVRLDPFTLPIRFTAGDATADERVRFVDLHRERVVMRRAVRGVPMALSLPISTYLGVAIRVVPPAPETDGAVAIVLEHRDPALSVPLSVAADGTDVVADWQIWARVLDLPLLVRDADGRLREPFRRIGALRVARVSARRRRRTAMKKRRPLILFRRRPGRPRAIAVVHCEREIIARN